MEHKEDKKYMRKEWVYLLFIIKFALGLYLIYWTIASTLKSDVGKDADMAFLSTKQEVDDNFNAMNISNKIFNEKYNIYFDFNGNVIEGIGIEDIFLGIRNIETRKVRRDLILVGENRFKITIEDKQGNPISNKKIELLVTKNTNHKEDVILEFMNEDEKTFTVNTIGYWNITGNIDVDGDKGYFYIKTNAKR